MAASTPGDVDEKLSPTSLQNVPIDADGSDMDRAWEYARQHEAAGEGGAGVDISRVLRKTDRAIMPILLACYTMQFLDKVLLNYAAIMSLRTDLGLVGNQFSNAATAFFVAYLIAELPNAAVLQKVSAAKWLGVNVVLWGIVCACTAAVRGYGSLLAARIFLGIFEAAIAPCLILLSSQYYTKSEQAPRFSFWYCGLGLGQIFGGLISYGFQNVHHAALAGWRIMFLAVGLLTVVVGVATLLLVPDSPMDARFLDEAEKMAVIAHVAENKTGISNTHFVPRQLLELLIDPQIWLLTVATILISVSSGVITTYSATLIRYFGFSPPVSALLNLPSGAVSIASTLLVGFGVRRLLPRRGHRWAWIAACCVPGVLGGALMSFAQRSRAALLAGIYLVNAVVATLPLLYAWVAANVAGGTKRAAAAALVSGAFSVGNIIGPQTFRASQAPGYLGAKVTVLATQAAGAAVAAGLALYYVAANRAKARREEGKKQRATEEGEREKEKGEGVITASATAAAEAADRGASGRRKALEDTGFANLTDRQMDGFRYSY